MKVIMTILIFFLTATVWSAPEQAKVCKNDNAREKPFTNSKVIAALTNGQSVDIQKREGSWYNISFQGRTGWIPMLSVQRSKQPSTSSKGSFSSTTTGRSANGGVVSTTGVRGLNDETLRTATFSETAVVAAEKNRVSTSEAAEFARASNIQPHTVPSLGGIPGIGGVK